MHIVKAPMGAAWGGVHCVEVPSVILKRGVFIMQQRLEHSPFLLCRIL